MSRPDSEPAPRSRHPDLLTLLFSSARGGERPGFFELDGPNGLERRWANLQAVNPEVAQALQGLGAELWLPEHTQTAYRQGCAAGYQMLAARIQQRGRPMPLVRPKAASDLRQGIERCARDIRTAMSDPADPGREALARSSDTMLYALHRFNNELLNDDPAYHYTVFERERHVLGLGRGQRPDMECQERAIAGVAGAVLVYDLVKEEAYRLVYEELGL